VRESPCDQGSPGALLPGARSTLCPLSMFRRAVMFSHELRGRAWRLAVPVPGRRPMRRLRIR
jgi:hypothetical protein